MGDGYRVALLEDPLPSIDYEVDQNMSGFFESFWSLNTPNHMLTTPSDALCHSICPLMVGECNTPERIHDFSKLFKNASYWIAVTQIIIYIIMVMISDSPLHDGVIDPYTLIKYGALDPKKIIVNHQLWRIITTHFMHGSFLHLSINLFIELSFVIICESSWGTIKFLFSLLLSTICASFVSIYYYPKASCVGASSGLYGVYGSFISCFVLIIRTLLLKKVIGVLIITCAMFIILFASINQNGIDTMGHIAGFVFGFFFGFILFNNKISNYKNEILIGSIIICFFSILYPIVLVYKSIHIYSELIIENALVLF